MKDFTQLQPLDFSRYSFFINDLSWLKDEILQNLLIALNQNQHQSLIVGGAVRNSLFKEKIDDIDIATTMKPDQVIECVKKIGFTVVTDGKEFGSIRAIKQKKIFEITTLRQDIKTDGRYAKVIFGTNWYEDAARRDFTINALYMNHLGEIYDPLNVIQDAVERKIVFIGDPASRIQEDYLRILRFFRFFAYYGKGAPDRDAIINITRYKSGLNCLSKQRVGYEFRKLLKAFDPMKALRWMRQSGVLTSVIAETEKWGIDEIDSLVKAEKFYHFEIDPILRLKAMIPPIKTTALSLISNLELTKKEGNNLKRWAKIANIKIDVDKDDFSLLLYQYGADTILDILKLKLSIILDKQNKNPNPSKKQQCQEIHEKIKFCENWEKPLFPVKGQDLLNIGYQSGTYLGETLKQLEQKWCDSYFTLSKENLLKSLK